MSSIRKTTMWMEFRRSLDCSQPYCRVVSHTEAEVRDILLALEQIYRPSFPALNLQQWNGSIYKWLTQPLLDPQKSGRVLMDPLMKLVTTALKWSYAQRESDVASKHLKAAAELLTFAGTPSRSSTPKTTASKKKNRRSRSQKKKRKSQST